jgi:hypothetical protein
LSLKHYALALVMIACAPPPTLTPVCAWVEGQVCRPPARAALLGARDREWEARELCPAHESLRYRACYVPAGVRDGRQVYVYRMFGGGQ